MAGVLLVTVRLHDGRYHGRPEWPPSPARLFQALVAGAAEGAALRGEDAAALAWLEGLDPPVIAAPAARDGQGFVTFVPNNDLDAVGGDPARVSEIRAAKSVKPRLFDAERPLVYAWRLDQGVEQARAVCRLADRLHRLGCGVDMAFAAAELADEDEAGARLSAAGGAVYRPRVGGTGAVLACPMPGSLDSLQRRHAAERTRLHVTIPPDGAPAGTGGARRQGQLFAQPPKARFAQVAYDSPPVRLLFDLRDAAAGTGFRPWPLERAVRLVETVRGDIEGPGAGGAAARLAAAMPQQAAVIARVFVGRGAGEADKAGRIRILPLPSIGHPHAEPSIRRLLVEIPPDCPLRADDIAWAFSGVAAADAGTGEILWTLDRADDLRMAEHYGIAEGQASRLWRTVTPAALPAARHHGRIGGGARMVAEDRAGRAVAQALRHAGIAAAVDTIRVQREPFAAKGARAEAFAPGTRFAADRLWHVEVAFAAPVAGPLVVGDGRYLGLGLMAPVKQAWRDHLVFALPGQPAVAAGDAPALLHAARRALMALARRPDGQVPRLFSGHEADGAPAASGRHEHVFLAADDADGDGSLDRLVVAAPWLCDRSWRGRHPDALFDRVVSGLREIRAGRLGVIALGRPSALAAGDRLCGPARRWQSLTPYIPTRHPGRRKGPVVCVIRDLIDECERRRLPRPTVDLLDFVAGPQGGRPAARLRLSFEVAIDGPLLLGRDSHAGGGLFGVADE